MPGAFVGTTDFASPEHFAGVQGRHPLVEGETLEHLIKRSGWVEVADWTELSGIFIRSAFLGRNSRILVRFSVCSVQ